MFFFNLRLQWHAELRKHPGKLSPACSFLCDCNYAKYQITKLSTASGKRSEAFANTFPSLDPTMLCISRFALAMQHLQAKFENSNALPEEMSSGQLTFMLLFFFFFHPSLIFEWKKVETSASLHIRNDITWQCCFPVSQGLFWFLLPQGAPLRLSAWSRITVTQRISPRSQHSTTLRPPESTKERHTHTLDSFFIRGQQMEAWVGDSLWVITPSRWHMRFRFHLLVVARCYWTMNRCRHIQKQPSAVLGAFEALYINAFDIRTRKQRLLDSRCFCYRFGGLE